EDLDEDLEEEATSAEEPIELEEEPLEEASLEDAESLLERAAPEPSDPTRRGWSAFKPVVTLHGYLRTRGEFQDSFNLGRTQARGVNNPGIPFERYTPASVGSS